MGFFFLIAVYVTDISFIFLELHHLMTSEHLLMNPNDQSNDDDASCSNVVCLLQHLAFYGKNTQD
jgi:hypothetical protein